jgi:hypothetical protein
VIRTPDQRLRVFVSSTLQEIADERKATLRLSRLWREQGKTLATRNLLSEAYAKMTEGFTLPDLQLAQALLKELA